MIKSCVNVPKILMPNPSIDLYKWAVVACDQYTSQPEYWGETDSIVDNAPSTLRLTLPEVYLDEADVADRTDDIHRTMRRYLADGILTELPAGFILTERYSGGNIPRRGLVLAVDLEAYDYNLGSQSLIRPTEKTVVERIPPRLKVRENAIMELPHIMLLIDDPEHSIIEPLFKQKEKFEKLYDTDLMQKGGHISGWFIKEGEITTEIIRKLDSLCDRSVFNAKYRLTEDLPVLPFAVGDGNHSMATAKAYWENAKKSLTQEEQADHPARYALVEVVNIHDESLIIEPIHRVMFHLDTEDFFQSAQTFYREHGCTAQVTKEAPAKSGSMHCFPFYTDSGEGFLVVHNPKWSLPLATLQTFLDDYLEKNPDSKIDYIHGENVVKSLGTKRHNLGFLLPDIEKNDLFRGVILDGVLPRKTFSMGEAHEKRFYMEAKKIVK